jgi:hypothetical protein
MSVSEHSEAENGKARTNGGSGSAESGGSAKATGSSKKKAAGKGASKARAEEPEPSEATEGRGPKEEAASDAKGAGSKAADSASGGAAEAGATGTGPTQAGSDGAGAGMERATLELKQAVEDSRLHAARRVGSVGKALHVTAESLREDHEEELSRYADYAGQQVEHVSSYLERRSAEELVADAGDAARRHPYLFLGGMFAAGFALAQWSNRAAAARDRAAARAQEAAREAEREAAREAELGETDEREREPDDEPSRS